MRLTRYLLTMKVSEIDNLIESIISNEIRKTILEQALEEKYEVYHIKCDDEPVETCHSEEEAQEIVNKLEKEHPGKQFIIEKASYESHSDMLDKLDEMGQQLEEKENSIMENKTPKFKLLAEAISHAKDLGLKKVKINGKVHDVEQEWNQLAEQEWTAMEENYPEQEEEGNEFSGALNAAKEAGHDTFNVNGKTYKVKSEMEETYDEEGADIEAGHSDGTDFEDILRGSKKKGVHDGDYDDMAYLDSVGYDDRIEEDSEIGEDEHQGHGFKSKVKEKLERELGRPATREELIKAVTKELEQSMQDDEEFFSSHPEPTEEECYECGHGDMGEGDGYHLTSEESKICNECGGMMNEEGKCNECGTYHQTMEESVCEKCGKEICECGSMMNESKKKTLRLTETELYDLITKMVTESIPGLNAYHKAHKESGKQNNKEIDDMMADVTKNHINIPGSDKPEFPHQNGKGEKVARENTKEDDETIEDNRGRNPFDLTYDIEPSQQFKDRLKKAIEGHSTMGNAPTTEPVKEKPSNGADKAEAPEQEEGNVIATPETGKKFEKNAKKRIEIKKKEPRYSKEPSPVKNVNESKDYKSKIISEEIEKMKNLLSYNKKTQ